MNNDEFNSLVEATLETCRDLMVRKGAEYAGTEDRLSNFKRGAELTGASPYQVCFIYLSKHYDSLATYVRDCARLGYPPKTSEPIEGRLDDLINYCILMKGLIVESNRWLEDEAEKQLRGLEKGPQPPHGPDFPRRVR